MSLYLGQILSFLTAPPGNLIYHIVLVFSIAGALQGAVQSLRSNDFPQTRRTVFGLSVLLVLQLILFFVSVLTSQGWLNTQIVLPPLDRAITLLMLVWIIWLWAFPEPVRLADAATGLLNLLVITLLALTLIFWAHKSAGFFNLTGYETGWQVLSILVALLGILMLVLRRPNGWSFGLSVLVLAFVGHLATVIFPQEGNFPGIVRLAQLAMFPILLTLPQRFLLPPPVRKAVGKPGGAEEPIRERRRYSTDPKTFHALMSLASETDSSKIGQTMTRGIAQAMLADLCFLLTMGEDKSLSISCGYDLIREENLGGTSIDRNSIPLLANAIQRGRPLRLPASSTSSDLKGLGQILNLSNPGNLLSVPIGSHERGPVGSILILSPYSNRLWSAEDQTFLSNVAPLFIPILERGQRAAAMEVEHDRAMTEARNNAEQALETRTKYEKMAAELEGQKEQLVQAKQLSENLVALQVAQTEAQKIVDELKMENERLRAASEAPGADKEQYGQMERELHQTLEEMAHMQNALADANIKLLELEKRPSAPITTEQVEVLASISQELRQPMSSIVGYTDLLMGESVGTLSALQRKFIERIKASTERIGGLVDDLIQTTNLETGKMEFKPEPIDLNLIIDNAMAYTSTQIREKNITLRLDLTGTAPRIQTDRDALQQILIHLLQNATAATQTEGNISLRVQMQDEGETHYLSIQVTDNGGGIATGDIPRVFSRRYRAEHSLIQGLGDTGVGLSIAKTLVEAQNGRIWVETETGVGSTFNVVMPVVVELPLENRS